MRYTSNTKLTAAEKLSRKDMRARVAAAGGTTFVSIDRSVVIVAVPRGNVCEVSTAIASPDEVKCRRKVGEFHALDRWYAAMYVPMPAATDFAALAEWLSEARYL